MFLLQIVTPDGMVVRFPGGGPLEREFVDTCVATIVAKGVGALKSQATVAANIRDGITEAIYALKADTRYVPK